jgi:hypothetical protein
VKDTFALNVPAIGKRIRIKTLSGIQKLTQGIAFIVRRISGNINHTRQNNTSVLSGKI